jgi:chaperone modulatory protein CbpM
MTGHYSTDETVDAIAALTHTRLTTYIEVGIIRPCESQAGPVFTPVDLARLELVCELAESHELAADALAMVMSLVDQLHASRNELAALGKALDADSDDVRSRVIAAWQGSLSR